MPVEHLIFAGGGSRGIAYGAVLDELVSSGCLNYNDLKSVAGTSFGAFIAVLVAVKMPPSRILELIHTSNVDTLINVDMSNLFYRWGLDDGKKLEAFVESLLQEQTGKSNLTLAALYDISSMDLYIPVTNLNTSKKVILTKDSFPNMTVATAVKMSMSLPPFFAPVYYDGIYYVDGGLMNNFPCDHIKDPSRMLGMRVTWDNAFNLNSLEQYFSRVIYVGLYNNEASQWKSLPDSFHSHVLKIPGGDVATINFRLAQSTMETLLQRAREETRKYCLENEWTHKVEKEQQSRDFATQTD